MFLNLNVLNIMLIPPHLSELSNSVLHFPFYHYIVVTSYPLLILSRAQGDKTKGMRHFHYLLLPH